MVKAKAGLAEMVNALAPELNTMLLSSTAAEKERPVMLERANVAISVGPLGTVAGVQFAAVPQSPVTGSRFQVALPARTVVRETRRQQQKEPKRAAAPGEGAFIPFF